MRIDSSGNVGIGTTSADTILHLSSSNDTALTIADTSVADTHEQTVLMNNSGNFNIRTHESDGTFKSIDYVINKGASGATSHAWRIENSEKMQIDSSGRLLVGTSSAPADSTFVVKSVYGANQPANVYLTSYDTAPSAAGSLGVIKFSDSGQTTAAQIQCSRDGGTWTSGSSQPTRLVFSTTADGASSPTERMRIDNDGRLSLGTTDNTFNSVEAKANFYQGATNSKTVINCVRTGTTSERNQISFHNPNGNVGNITTSGSTTAYNTSSDYRLKENVNPVTDGITRLQQLKPSRFNFIADPGTVVDGFIAHEVQTIVPEAITGEKDAVDDDGNPEYQGIDQSKLVPLLTAALQEAIAKIEILEAKVTALEAS